MLSILNNYDNLNNLEFLIPYTILIWVIQAYFLSNSTFKKNKSTNFCFKCKHI